MPKLRRARRRTAAWVALFTLLGLSVTVLAKYVALAKSQQQGLSRWKVEDSPCGVEVSCALVPALCMITMQSLILMSMGYHSASCRCRKPFWRHTGRNGHTTQTSEFHTVFGKRTRRSGLQMKLWMRTGAGIS
jgi:hypothetical protein